MVTLGQVSKLCLLGWCGLLACKFYWNTPSVDVAMLFSHFDDCMTMRNRGCRTSVSLQRSPTESLPPLLSVHTEKKPWSRKRENTSTSQYQGTGDARTQQTLDHSKFTVFSATFSQLNCQAWKLFFVSFFLVLLDRFQLHIPGWSRYMTSCLSLQSSNTSVKTTF